MNHLYCPENYGTYCDECANLPASDEALARLRTLLDGEDVFAPAAVALTVYTAEGTVTVENIREDSIKREGSDLIAEADDGSSKCPLFRFFGVIGYSTTFA